MTEVGDCRPICTRCSEAIEIESVREDGWIYLKPHKCKPQLRAVPDTDDAACTGCKGTGWDRTRERACSCIVDPAAVPLPPCHSCGFSYQEHSRLEQCPGKSGFYSARLAHPTPGDAHA